MKHECNEQKIPQAQSPNGKKNSTWCDLLIKRISIESIWKIFKNNFHNIILRIVENNYTYNVKCY